MNKRLNKRQIQAQITYENIYNAAMSLVEKKGFENITVEEICTKAGVSVGSFYNYFKSKQDILNEIFRIADDYFLNTVSNVSTGQDAYENIVNFFAHYAKYCEAIKIDQLKQIYSTSNILFIEEGRHMQSVLKDIIDAGKESGQINTDMQSEEIVRYLFIALRGVIFDWCLHGGSYDLVEFVTNYTRRLIRII
ncbi:TetR/AcrR family transcriptional regulator [Tissierella carlieri]|uniref:TetR/AcrR family transcriptional regulator n=1 Tax=Tissierella carlieri TaxID=689904 RepID=A0ABT1SGP8_9FIRM|nr:TetR/AcrR family transcriptional regulator [Tissierella carlieri]MBU5310683.1 TetR/AcrR family transcriptional regulator [Tissierella carlieri]MCQ4925673.1 TetR/AcrR family transcriptional regulator [Tissierella carlieri]